MYIIGYNAVYTLLFYPEFIMKIIALSDQHGNLNQIKDTCDVVVIAGDWSPLYCQHDSLLILNWCNKRFVPWMKSLKSKHVIFIPGNHDFSCTYKTFSSDFMAIADRYGLSDKIHYLCHNAVEIDGVKFYGNPNTESLSGWAFSKRYEQTYDFDSDTDVLITHQPPKVGEVGYVRQFNREFGSIELYNRILDSNIKLNICGHIHTGSHEKQAVKLNNGKTAFIQNVSILDEEYNVAYEPTVIRL